MHLVYFPYLHMDRHREFTFLLNGREVKVWNYRLMIDEYVQDKTTKDKIQEILAIHKRDSGDKPIEDIGIVSIDITDFRTFNEEEMKLCEEVRLLMFISSLARYSTLERGPNTGHSIATSDNFILQEKYFELTYDRMTIFSGYIVEKRDMGWLVSEVRINKPHYVPTPFDIQGDQDIIKTLLMLRVRNKKLYLRAMRSVDAVMSAYFNDREQHNPQFRLLMMCSAIEILFDLPESQPRQNLKEIIKRDFAKADDLRVRYKSQRGANRSEWEIESIQVMWADKFYSARNKIIHGGKISESDYVFRNKQRHVDIAVLYIILGIRKFAGKIPRGKPTYDEIIWKNGDLEDEFTDVFDGFVYERWDPWVI